MILDVINGQEQLDSVTQSYGNPIEANMVAYLVQFINEHAKVPFNRKLFYFGKMFLSNFSLSKKLV